MSNYQKALEFRRLMGQPIGVLTRQQIEFQLRLIVEEFKEVVEATDSLSKLITCKRASEAVLKEIADLVVVAYQFSAAAGWDLDEALDRVHKSNLSKLDDDGKPVRRADGKILKSHNYQPPQLIDLV
jgi:predicted HAD superfamily Cof-like phosphohydrolase